MYVCIYIYILYVYTSVFRGVQNCFPKEKKRPCPILHLPPKFSVLPRYPKFRWFFRIFQSEGNLLDGPHCSGWTSLLCTRRDRVRRFFLVADAKSQSGHDQGFMKSHTWILGKFDCDETNTIQHPNLNLMFPGDWDFHRNSIGDWSQRILKLTWNPVGSNCTGKSSFSVFFCHA